MEFAPDRYPPFPGGIEPRAQLDTLSLRKLQNEDRDEQAKLLRLCQTKGFFFLDFYGTTAGSLPQQAESVARISQALFALAKEEKIAYSLGTYKPYSLLGQVSVHAADFDLLTRCSYKQSGTTVTDSAGTRDTAEFWNIGKDDILETEGCVSVKYPSLIHEPSNHQLLADFQKCCHRTGLDIMAILAARVGLPFGAFEHNHRIDKPSDDHIRIAYGPPRNQDDLIQTPGHTDFGLITILFNWLGGLQIWSEPSRDNFHRVFDGVQPSGSSEGRVAEWLWVEPKPGCAILNLGDAAVKFTGGLLCSARHRVVPAPGDQGRFARYSVVYFVRPEDDAVLKRIEDGNVPKAKEGEDDTGYTTREWVAKQYALLQAGR